jgi:hypothetical protein
MGFTRTGADDGRDHPELSDAGDEDGLADPPEILSADVDLGSRAHVTEVVAATDATAATAQTMDGMGQSFWRSLVRSVDGVIKSNSTAQVIPSAEAIAAEVLKQQKSTPLTCPIDPLLALPPR